MRRAVSVTMKTAAKETTKNRYVPVHLVGIKRYAGTVALVLLRTSTYDTIRTFFQPQGPTGGKLDKNKKTKRTTVG